jgi:hypothetical protein
MSSFGSVLLEKIEIEFGSSLRYPFCRHWGTTRDTWIVTESNGKLDDFYLIELDDCFSHDCLFFRTISDIVSL